ncbi:short-chain dehydrogenase/oxidoreductase [Penicillium chermesinum]|uniref:Short-chain dehydrogenase/oxidoreductase n=1 Tax=Penicillium chermesinum TaxID=63820 RepID=A0A9W9NGW6_9EURO|nr:short-chain dehydrogenase/oxidoreductase [Penicillium chermesinum]KAJ5219682.1 short-chain dehydrogenase/oxidoreductase [Penicillium chermesinum]
MSFPYKHVLVIGATAGIGRALADRFVQTGLKVTAVGRRQERLRRVREPARKIPAFVESITKKHPDIDLVLLNAGLQRPSDLSKPETVSMDLARTQFEVNFFSVVALTNAFLPFFYKKNSPTALAFTTSNLSYVPGFWVPFYSATKAALSSYALSLRESLRNQNVKVLELSPPAVQTELHDFMGEDTGRKVGMPLDKFTDEALEGFLSGKDQIVIGPFPPAERFLRIVDTQRAAFEDLSKMYRSH